MIDRLLRFGIAVCFLSALASPAAAQLPAGFVQEPVATGLALPTCVAPLPDGRMLVGQQNGVLYIVDPVQLTKSVAGTIPVAFCQFLDYEIGLLGIDVDPDYTTNRFFYVYRTTTTNDPCDSTGRTNQVVRFTMAVNDHVNLNSATPLITGIRTDSGYHNGGALRVSADGHIFVGVGECGVGDFGGGGPGTSTNPYAQDLSAKEGKILRINSDGSVPQDNPFVSTQNAQTSVFARGFRNPFRIGIDPANGNLWVGDVGEDNFEEIDFVKSGANCGWPLVEGKTPGSKNPAGGTLPVLTYPHSGAGSLGGCVVGGDFADDLFGFAGGCYFFADYESGCIYRAILNSARTGFSGKPVLFSNDAGTICDLRFGADGSLYFVSNSGGHLSRIRYAFTGLEEPLKGTALTLNGGPKPLLTITSTDSLSIAGGPDNPTEAGGSLHVFGTGFNQTYMLPSGKWKLVGKGPDKVTGLQYTDAAHESGPVTSIKITGGSISIKASGTGLGIQLTNVSPTQVHAVLTVGTHQYCWVFGGSTTYNGLTKTFTAKNAVKPGGC